jgi:hypothetical protein
MRILVLHLDMSLQILPPHKLCCHTNCTATRIVPPHKLCRHTNCTPTRIVPPHKLYRHTNCTATRIVPPHELYRHTNCTATQIVPPHKLYRYTNLSLEVAAAHKQPRLLPRYCGIGDLLASNCDFLFFRIISSSRTAFTFMLYVLGRPVPSSWSWIPVRLSSQSLYHFLTSTFIVLTSTNSSCVNFINVRPADL